MNLSQLLYTEQVLNRELKLATHIEQVLNHESK